jgi:hypothetical protein
VEGANLFRGGIWIAIVVIVMAIGGVFVVRHFHDRLSPAKSSAATPTTGSDGFGLWS